jgi:hypothetical protein
MKKEHQANQAFWNSSTKRWKEMEDQRGLWMKAHEDPTLVLSSAEMPYLKDVAGKDVCVLGSGDNEVAFALRVSAVVSRPSIFQSVGLLSPQTGLVHSDCN